MFHVAVRETACEKFYSILEKYEENISVYRYSDLCENDCIHFIVTTTLKNVFEQNLWQILSCDLYVKRLNNKSQLIDVECNAIQHFNIHKYCLFNVTFDIFKEDNLKAWKIE